MTSDRRYLLAAALLVAVCVLATVPTLEMGVNDDFTYNATALSLARTGHLIYHGWAATMVGVQAWWAAALIRLFGFSFTLVRLSTLPLAVGFALLLYLLGRETGLNPPFALFGALAAALSPVFIPEAASFMTDVPGAFCWVACAYCAMRAARAPGRGNALAWLCASAVMGIAGGTVRQFIWAEPLLIIPLVAWARRKDGLYPAASALWLATAGSVGLLFRWYQSQPNVLALSDTGKVALSLDTLSDEVQWAVRLAVCCLFLALPALSIALADWREWLRDRRAVVLGFAGCGALLVLLQGVFQAPLLLGDVMTRVGILYANADLMGRRVEVLRQPILLGLGGAILVTAGAAAASLLHRRGFSGSPRLLVRLLFPPCAVYMLALLYRAENNNILFDRYVIPLFPLLIIPLLWHYQQGAVRRPPVWAWAVLGLFACYGIATTHDYLAAGRARVQAAEVLLAHGIPRTRFTAGLEYDGWTEIQQTGHIYDAPPPDDAHDPNAPPFWFLTYTPSVQPRYYVVYSPVHGLLPSDFPPVRYTTWLPPFHRQLLIELIAGVPK